MEITKNARFIVPFYGSAPAKGYLGVLQGYVTDKIDKTLLTFAQQNLKKGQEIDTFIEDILSVFHRDDEGCPFIGNWMLRRCFIETGRAIFNAAKNKNHPKKDLIPMAVQRVEAFKINVFNGQKIEKADGVAPYAVTIREAGKPRSFFKAYEWIKEGATFSFTAYFDDDMISPEIAEFWLDKACMQGVGAFRERFGKFEYV